MGSSASSPLCCPRCGITIANTTLLVDHLKQKHLFGTQHGLNRIDSDNTQYGSRLNGLTSETVSSDQKLVCEICHSLVPSDSYYKHFEEEHFNISCPICNKTLPKDEKLFIKHLEVEHRIKSEEQNVQRKKCKYCSVTLPVAELVDHLANLHITDPADQMISCPKCNKKDIKSGEDFLNHLKDAHKLGEQSGTPDSNREASVIIDGNKKLPKQGDKVYAMWSDSIWQYFGATIKTVHRDTLKYEIDWDDGDTTGRIVDYYNLAIDRSPVEDELGIGSIILFPQGGYSAGASQLTGGERWHQGQITNVTVNGGVKYYDGNHTKGGGDGKFVTYKGYNYTFSGYRLNQLRVGPNAFDIVDDTDDTDSSSNAAVDYGDIDIYFSSVPKTDSVCACKPTAISDRIKTNGFNIIQGKNFTGADALKEKVSLMKKSKVFVACIDDEYVLNEDCRMEFQYAKATLKKPVIPLIFGESKQWSMSVVGMLIAGELYIHYKNQSVQEKKFEETLQNLSKYISLDAGAGAVEAVQAAPTAAASTPPEIFISYCWNNSTKQRGDTSIGGEYSDPRLVADKVVEFGYSVWLDIQQLTSANLFEQLSQALKDAKLVVAFISAEYGKSANCCMEFQFALKSLAKKVIPVIVGKGDEWKQTVVGMLLASQNIEPISIQFEDGANQQKFQSQMDILKERIQGALTDDRPATAKKVSVSSNVARVGDHVVSHHFKYAYYMATIASYDSAAMQFTVDWDDGDSTGKVQAYNKVAKDVIPDQEAVGVGSTIFFPQGSYGGTAGNNTGGQRYHEGVVTKIHEAGSGTLYDGHHMYGEDDGKWVTYSGYVYTFTSVSLNDIRISSSGFDLNA